MERFDGFTVNLFLDDNNEWLAHFIEMPNISAYGDSPEEALAELDNAWELAKKTLLKKQKELFTPLSKKKFTGRFNVRIDKALHKSLAVEAAILGVSLNALVSKKLSISKNF